LEKAALSDFKDADNSSKLIKQLTKGDNVTMVCHLVKCENHLGSSTVIDLTSTEVNKVRQVDHRSIDFIIFNNVKYLLKKGAKKSQDQDMEEEKEGEPQWDKTKLEIGNWFSSTNYFKVKKIVGQHVETTCSGKAITVSKDIMEHEMHNASVFAKEEKLSLIDAVKLLKESNSTVISINFNCKLDDKILKEKFDTLSKDDLVDRKKLAAELMKGREVTAVGRLSKQEGKLGRSLMVVFEGSGGLGKWA
jgi:hypothetical protein